MEKYRVLFETIFKKKLTDQDAVGHLEKITAEHPYFSAAQFYLLQLMPKDAAAYKIQAKRTAALFNNNHWLNFQLLEAGKQTAFSSTLNTVPVTEPGTIPARDEIDPVTAYAPSTIENIVMDQTETPPVIVEAPEEIVHEPKEETDTVTAPAPSTIESIVMDQTETPPVIVEQVEVYSEAENDTVTEIDTIQDEPLRLKAGEIEIFGQTVVEENTNAIEAATRPQQVADELTGAVPQVEEEQVGHDLPLSTVPTAEVAIVSNEQLEKDAINEADDTDAPETEAVSESPVTAIAFTSALSEPAVQEPAADLLFEPLHTSDYFASVGIRLSEEEKTADKLGKQLKSFTDWLKTMKKTHAGQLTQVTKPAAVETSAADSNIQKLAEKSNQENDVITEAMAEVLVQQGRQDKALEILEKLSLLNPTKSAYFAAKINQIKEK